MALVGRLWFLGCLAAFIAACASMGTPGDPLTIPPAKDATTAPSENQILVTFHDEREARVPMADPANAYRRRGNYQNSSWSRRITAQLAEQYGLRPVAQWPITTLGIHCVVYEVPASQSVDRILRRLEQDRRVEAAQSMNRFHVMTNAYTDPYFKLQTGVRSMRVESAHRVATGRDVKVAIIDTGVDTSHPDLTGQVSRIENFVSESPQTADIHGTAVAGIIAALANNGKGIVGIAPGAQLIALKACWQNGPQRPDAACNTFTLALALNTAITLKPEVLNLSLTGPKDPLLERLIDKALDARIVVVASDPATGDDHEAFPASMKGVIAVRTVQTKEPGDVSGARSIAAPGVEVLTTLPHGTYNFMSGSSFAAAHVSGVIALMLELNPQLTGQRVASILRGTMTPLPGLTTTGTVDACAAVASIRGVTACTDMAAHISQTDARPSDL
jgi:hypothetical protein